jgi:hypothetical protein
MSQADPLDNAARTHHVAKPRATAQPSGSSIRLDHFLHHPRLEPILRKMFPDQRRYERIILPNVVAYLGKAHASRPHQIGNISVGGFCMIGDEQWTPGTEMPITLQREDWDGDESSECITVQAIVVRRARRKVGFSIALSAKESIAFSDPPYGSVWISRSVMERFLENLKKPKSRRLLSIYCPEKMPLTIAERTQRLIDIARSHSISETSEILRTRGGDLHCPR